MDVLPLISKVLFPWEFEALEIQFEPLGLKRKETEALAVLEEKVVTNIELTRAEADLSEDYSHPLGPEDVPSRSDDEQALLDLRSVLDVEVSVWQPNLCLLTFRSRLYYFVFICHLTLLSESLPTRESD